MGFEGWQFSDVRVTGSTLTPSNERDTAVLVGGEASAAEIEEGTPAYGTLGLVFRPRRPEPEVGATDDPKTNELYAKAMAVRHGERLVPIAWRDPRLNRVYEPDEGDIALVGYGGGYIALQDTASLLTRLRLRVPFSGGTLEIVLDPDDESITVTHSSGVSIELRDGQLTATAPTVHVDSPNVILGADGRPVACVGDIVGGTVYGLCTAPASPLSPNPAPAPGTGVPFYGKILSGVTGVRAGNGS